MTQAYTIEYIRSVFENDGYNLITTVYKNNKQKLEYKCPRNHIGSIAWNHYQEGHRCLRCVGIENSKRFRMNFDLIKDDFIRHGYTLLTDEYINAHQQLRYTCPDGHEGFMTWNNWSKGYRCPVCFSIKFSGAGHPNWKGGISCEPYCDIWRDEEYKKSILKRDNYTCQRCGITNTLSLSIHGCRLNIHHIDYNKKNCAPSNLITLCRSCNLKANTDRSYWTDFYKDIVGRRV